MTMKIAIFESGDYHDAPDIIRVFVSVEKAKENIPPEFRKKDFYLGCHYYADKINQKWLSIKEYEVED